MPYVTTLNGRGLGMVEIFRNPSRREWNELKSIADPIDGIRGYLVGADLYTWGSLPLHRDVGPFLRKALPAIGPWIGVQINPVLATVVVSEHASEKGSPLPLDQAVEDTADSANILRLLGKQFVVRSVGTSVVPKSNNVELALDREPSMRPASLGS